jgi:FtsZ-binding cell division protein ZapB
VVSPIIDSTKKNNKIMVDAMDKIIVTQLDIEEHGSKLHNHTFKEQVHNLKSRNKDLHNMGKAWSISYNLIIM